MVAKQITEKLKPASPGMDFLLLYRFGPASAAICGGHFGVIPYMMGSRKFKVPLDGLRK